MLALTLVVVAVALGAAAAHASAHAVFVTSDPAPGARVAAAPDAVRLDFNEPVSLVVPDDVRVLDPEGGAVTAGGAATAPSDAATVLVPLRAELPEGTYTVRYSVMSADSHIIRGVHVFGVGDGPLAAPVATTAAVPAETGPWGVSARFLELVAIGGLAGVLAFRWLVWRPALARAPIPGGSRQPLEAWGRDLFWGAFGLLAIAAILAEAYALVVKSAGVLGSSVASALGDPGGLGLVLTDTRFGGFVQARAAGLFVLFAVGSAAYLAEHRAERPASDPPAAGGRGAALVMAALLVLVLGSFSLQGHASQAPLATLSVLADALHLGAVAVWIAGLALVSLTLWRLPRDGRTGGSSLATAVLVRFSGVALVAVAVALVTGLARSVGQLSDPAQLWETGHGVSILVKLLLLCPLAVLALMNRRVVTALRRSVRPRPKALAVVRRRACAELALGLAVVMVAALLVAQVPGRV